MEKTKILIAIDEPELAEIITKTALKFIDITSTEITLLNVLETTIAEEEFFLREPEKFIQHEARKSVFADVENYLETEDFNYKGLKFKEGNAADCILKLAKDENCNLIVLGCNNKNIWEKFLLGSTSYRVVRESKIPVLIIKPDKNLFSGDKKQIDTLFCTDGSEYSKFSANNLSKYIDKNKHQISIINVRVPLSSIIAPDTYQYTDFSKIIEESKLVAQDYLNKSEKILKENGLYIKAKYDLEGDPATVIIKEAKEKYDLIVMGSHGNNVISDFLMGSVTNKVYENSSKAILIMKK